MHGRGTTRRVRAMHSASSPHQRARSPAGPTRCRQHHRRTRARASQRTTGRPRRPMHPHDTAHDGPLVSSSQRDGRSLVTGRMAPDARRSRLVDVTLDLLRDHAPAELAVDDVAVAAGVSCGLVYRYFADLDELLVAACQRFFVRPQIEIEALLHTAPDARTGLLRAVYVYLEFAQENATTFRHVVDGGIVLNSDVRCIRSKRFRRLARFLGDDTGAVVTATAIVGLLESATLAWLEHGDDDIEQATSLVWGLTSGRRTRCRTRHRGPTRNSARVGHSYWTDRRSPNPPRRRPHRSGAGGPPAVVRDGPRPGPRRPACNIDGEAVTAATVGTRPTLAARMGLADTGRNTSVLVVHPRTLNRSIAVDAVTISTAR